MFFVSFYLSHMKHTFEELNKSTEEKSHSSMQEGGVGSSELGTSLWKLVSPGKELLCRRRCFIQCLGMQQIFIIMSMRANKEF